ncbi:MAG: nitrilase-related carbon-nitrogen hydrolase [Anaerolineae bacterium]
MKAVAETVTVAAVNFRPRFGAIGENLERIEAWVADLAGRGASLICFPELAVTGYDRTPAIRELAQTVPGPAADRLAAIAQRWRADVLAGLPERDADGRLYIAQIIAGADGAMAVYRKLHLNAPERATYTPGEALGVFRRPNLTCGVQLCYDAHFPELSTLQALAGADLLCIASASPRDEPEEKAERMLRYLRARAYDNSCYVVACNLVGEGAQGQRFGGVALALDPKGELLASHVGWEEGYVLATVDMAALRRIRRTVMGYFLPHRRADLYRRLAEQIGRDGSEEHHVVP